MSSCMLLDSCIHWRIETVARIWFSSNPILNHTWCQSPDATWRIGHPVSDLSNQWLTHTSHSVTAKQSIGMSLKVQDDNSHICIIWGWSRKEVTKELLKLKNKNKNKCRNLHTCWSNNILSLFCWLIEVQVSWSVKKFFL